MKVQISIRNTKESWKKTKFFCMSCGNLGVWFRDDGGDYYHGDRHMCSRCGVEWDMPHLPSGPDDPDSRQRFEELRKANAP